MNKQLRILILEDDDTDAELMEHELRKANFTFTSKRVETGDAFQENLVDFAPELILADYTLPSFDGCSALRIAKEKCPDVPFIFVSGTIGEDFAIESLKSGATDYILKDRLSRLAPAVHRALSEVGEKIEYRKAEKALKESELRFRSVVQSANDAIILMDGRCVIFSWNTGAQAMFGYMEKEVIGKSISHIIPERYKKDHMKKIECASLAGKPGINGKRIESYGLRKGGIEFPVDISMATWKTEEGNFYSAIIRDITEREQAEEKLRLFRSLIDQSNDAIFVSDPETGRILDANDKACINLGYKREEFFNMRVMDFEVNLPDQFSWKEHVGKVQSRRHLILEGLHRRKDGTIFPVEVNVSFIVLEKIDYMLAVVRDITERKQAEAAIQEREERLHQAVGVSQIGIFDHDHRTDTIYWSPEQRHIYGWGPEEPVTLPEFLNHVYPEDRERIAEAVRRAHDPSGDGSFDVEHRIIDRNGAIHWLSTRSRTHFEGEGSSCHPVRTVGASADITERKRAEENIEASLKEKETLLREIHHRVKNNMQIVSSLLGLQAESIKEEKYLEMFKDSRNRIMSMYIIHEKLYRSKDLEKIEFNEYIRDLANGLLQSHGVEAGKVELNINVGDTSLGIDFAIPCGLIINELITNSLKYAFPDGRNGKISISLHPFNKNMFELVVSDNGVGFPSDVDFRKTESLGLRLVTILAENQLHGQIDLNRSGGTEFTIKFKGVK
ncbi:MAG: PAS domain S-box protein [Candidatus Methanoperedens sp.]|nr:PAS domain S-box protein [Candidatus Methanoperedens sp.]